MAALKEISDYLRALGSHDQAVANATTTLSDLEEKRRALDDARQKELERILAEQGLTLCTKSHYLGKTKEERLGLVKESEARLFRSTEGRSYDSHLEISRLCSRHAPSEYELDKPEWIDGISRYLSFVTEVVRQSDGRLIQKMDGEDVSDLTIIEEQYSEGLYHHFGLPTLPLISDLSSAF